MVRGLTSWSVVNKLTAYSFFYVQKLVYDVYIRISTPKNTVYFLKFSQIFDRKKLLETISHFQIIRIYDTIELLNFQRRDCLLFLSNARILGIVQAVAQGVLNSCQLEILEAKRRGTS